MLSRIYWIDVATPGRLATVARPRSRFARRAGRSSVIAARALIGLGLQPEDALARIEHARGLRVPDTEAQRRWVLEFRMSPT
jgi:hypothetical protein